MMFSDSAQNILILSCLCFHVLYAPYTKVEESFNLHAIHDILFFGLTPQALTHFDHFQFPGVVPRSFVGSIALSLVVQPIVRVGTGLGLVMSKRDIQVLVRMLLALANGIAICLLRRAVRRQFGKASGTVFTLLTVSQYHVPFWAGRTLPNMFALVPVNIAFYVLFDWVYPSISPGGSVDFVIATLVFATVTLRAEIALLLGPLCLQLLLTGRVSLYRLIKIGFISTAVSLVMTVTVDSYMWDTWPLWPELNGILFNVFQGKSADWGVSPAYTYALIFVPKLLIGATPLTIIGLLGNFRIRQLLLPSLCFIALISALGHKEWRFIVYTVSLFNIGAARGAVLLTNISRNGSVKNMLRLSVGALLALNFAVTALLTQISRFNYPGGQALWSSHTMLQNHSHVHLHIDNLAAQTGASLFLQLRALDGWTYSKAELVTDFSPFTHVITENLDDFIPNSGIISILPSDVQISLNYRLGLVQVPISSPNGSEWRLVAFVLGFDGWRRPDFTPPTWKSRVPIPYASTKLYLLERIE